MVRRAIASTQPHKLLGKPHQGGTVRIYPWYKLQHLIRITDASGKKFTLFLLKADLCRHIDSRQLVVVGDDVPSS
jgi:hypothetical protein